MFRALINQIEHTMKVAGYIYFKDGKAMIDQGSGTPNRFEIKRFGAVGQFDINFKPRNLNGKPVILTSCSKVDRTATVKEGSVSEAGFQLECFDLFGDQKGKFVDTPFSFVAF